MIHQQKNDFVTSSKNDFDALIKQAETSKRKRHLLQLHPTHEAELHSMINVFCKGSYVQPHRHLVIDKIGKKTSKGESFVALKGKGRIIQFNDKGNIIGFEDLEAEQQSMLWIPHYCWHTVLALSPIFIVFENKTGPWQAATDKAFHPCFPNENGVDYEKFILNWENLG